MNSKFRSRCKKCGGRISIGAPIYWSKETGALCLTCGAGGKAEGSKPEKGKTSSHLTPDGSEFFVIDWSELKEIVLAFIRGDYSAVTRTANVNQIKAFVAGSDWHGYTGGQLERWLTEGYRADAISGLADFIPPIREKRRLQFTDEGDEFHLDLAHNGDDNYMSQWTKRETIPGLGIEAAIMFSAGTDAKTVNAYNVWLCRTAFSLESSGVDCEITLSCPSYNMVERTNRNWNSVVRLKRENEMTDYVSWSPMLSPAALRCFGFTSMVIHADRKGRDASPSLGRGSSYRDWQLAYDKDRRVLRVENDYSPMEFPETRLTEDLRAVLKQIRG